MQWQGRVSLAFAVLVGIPWALFIALGTTFLILRCQLSMGTAHHILRARLCICLSSDAPGPMAVPRCKGAGHGISGVTMIQTSLTPQQRQATRCELVRQIEH
jgi:hypothetical protein